MVSSYDDAAIHPGMTTFILHPQRLARAAETLVEEADAIGAALDIDPPDTGWCDHGWFDGMLVDAAVLKRDMTFNAWRANAIAHAAIELDGMVALVLMPMRPVT